MHAAPNMLTFLELKLKLGARVKSSVAFSSSREMATSSSFYKDLDGDVENSSDSDQMSGDLDYISDVLLSSWQMTMKMTNWLKETATVTRINMRYKKSVVNIIISTILHPIKLYIHRKYFHAPTVTSTTQGRIV